MNTTDFLSIATSICPDRIAIVFEGQRFTFSQLNERANRLANALSDLGVKKGDGVAILQVNSNQSVEAYFATAKLGAIYVPINYRAKEDELIYVLNNVVSSVLLVGERYLEVVESIAYNLEFMPKLISLETPHKNMLYYPNLIEAAPTTEVSSDIEDNDVTILLYTTGTSGLPKGVMLSHKSFAIYVLENVTPANQEIQEVNIIGVPLYHVAGIQAMLSAIYGGRTMVIERQFQPKEWMGLVEEEKVTRAMMVPTMLKQIIDHPDFYKYDLSSLKIITYGAAPMPINIIRKAVELLPDVSFINAFGQTETASTITILGPEDHIITGSEEEKNKKLKRLTSIGKPLPDIEMKIVNKYGKELPTGKIGEIVARGPRIMNGYWKDERITKKIIDEAGFVHTGDMGYVDEDGYFYLLGRSTDMIIRGGENISPAEVEAVLHSHPEIEEAAVIGVPDEEWGEQPVAIVALKPEGRTTAEEVMEYCRAKMASFKRPRAVVFVDKLPRNSMGKILRKELREKYSK